MTAELVLDISGFKIKKISWHVFKYNINVNKTGGCLPLGKGTTDILNGKDAYLLAHKTFNALLDLPGGSLLRYAFIQCSKAVVQAETFLYKERGFATKEEYDVYWDQLEAEGCRFYTHPEAGDLRWSEYVGNFQRGDYIFERFKTFVEMDEENVVMRHGTFSDSYHQIEITVTVSKSNGRIEDFDVKYIRVPGNACRQCEANAEVMIGENAMKLDKKTIVSKLGGGSGCYHIVDLTWDIICGIQME